jgi:hypothetical protein
MNTSTLSADTIIATGKSMTKKANAIASSQRIPYQEKRRGI